jgi:hypothetical protein
MAAKEKEEARTERASSQNTTRDQDQAPREQASNQRPDSAREAEANQAAQEQDAESAGAFPTLQYAVDEDEPNAGLLELPKTEEERAQDMTAKAVAGDPAVSPNVDSGSSRERPAPRRVWASDTSTIVAERGQPDPLTTDVVIHDL